jgi:hypothetical protein
MDGVTYLDRVQHFNHAGMAQSAQLFERILGDGEGGSMGRGIEGEYAAIGAVLLS